MSDESTIRYEPTKPPPMKSNTQLVVGFLVGGVLWLPTMLKSEAAIAFLIFVPFGEPILGAILAAIPATRKLGLGILLAAGLGWLILGAICAGLVH